MRGVERLHRGEPAVKGTRCPRLAAVALVLCVGVGACDGADAAGGESGTDVAQDTMLQRLAADLLPAAEIRSGLPARGPINLARRSKEGLEAFLAAEMAAQLPPERLEAVVRTYARLGLVPDSIDLEPLLQSLLLEQVVGYYDPERDTLYVVEGADETQLEPVVLHEIVHALQDQYVDLDSLMAANQERNDRGTAAQAAMEGHATFAMLEWQLSRLVGDADLTALPGLDALLGDDPLAAAGLEMPVLAEAPAVIRESLLFPYIGGLVYLQKHWAGAWGRVPPLGPEMPVSTEQILHPERFAPGAEDMPTLVTFQGELPADWEEVLTDDLGELETRIFLREFLPDRAAADRAAAGWDGDRFRLFDGPAGETLLWYTVWDTDRDGLEFADAVTAALIERYGGSPLQAGREVRINRRMEGNRHVVVVWDLTHGHDLLADLEELEEVTLAELEPTRGDS